VNAGYGHNAYHRMYAGTRSFPIPTDSSRQLSARLLLIMMMQYTWQITHVCMGHAASQQCQAPLVRSEYVSARVRSRALPCPRAHLQWVVERKNTILCSVLCLTQSLPDPKLASSSTCTLLLLAGQQGRTARHTHEQ
jgi:hypothetical protein